MCLKSGFLLIGLLSLFSSLSGPSLRTWHGIPDESLARLSPASAGMAAVFGLRPSDYDTGGLRDESYLAIPRVPEWLPDMAGSLYLDMPPVEPETEAQTRAAHYYGESDWVGETPAASNRGLQQPSTRGEATYYHPSLAWADDMRGGGKYDPRDATIGAVADIRGKPVVELGRMLEVCHQEADTCIVVTVKDTGPGFPRHDLDLSEAAWLALSGGKPLTAGRLEIEWRVLE